MNACPQGIDFKAACSTARIDKKKRGGGVVVWWQMKQGERVLNAQELTEATFTTAA